MRIGIVGDTHIPQASPLLPARITEVLKGLDIILHVGDICEVYVLEELQETFTLTFAVWGEADTQDTQRYLDEKRVVRFGERRVGMIHGHQLEAHWSGARGRIRRLLGRAAEPEADNLPSFLLEQFDGEAVDAIVFGHTHQPYVKMHKGVLLFNPGAALPGVDRQASAGILDVEERNITGKVVPL